MYFEFKRSLRSFATLTSAVVMAAVATTCQAHFLWIKSVEVDGKPQGLLFFGETPAEETYHFPDKLAKVKLWSRAADGKRSEVATKSIDTDERVGLIGPLADAKTPALETSQQYGVYGNALLIYHAKHVNGSDTAAINQAGTSKELRLEIVPQVKGNEVELTILWDGKPLKDAPVTLMVDGADPEEKKADDKGHVSFKSEKGGLIGVLANTMEKDKAGELDKKAYKGAMHYASLTFSLP